MEMKASRQLRDEHEGIRVMLRIMEAVRKRARDNGELDKDHFTAILDFLQVFVDQCHHAKEEEGLFPALEAAGVPRDGGPIGVMLDEHVLGRELVRAMDGSFRTYDQGERSALKDVLHNIQEYVALLSGHIDKENGILFDTADHMLPETKQRELQEGFDGIEEERIGAGKHEAFHALIQTLGNIYLS